MGKGRDKRRKRKSTQDVVKPVVEVDDATLWDRIRQRYANMRFRNFTLSFIPYGPKVKASSPEELAEKVNEAVIDETKKKPEN